MWRTPHVSEPSWNFCTLRILRSPLQEPERVSDMYSYTNLPLFQSLLRCGMFVQYTGQTHAIIAAMKQGPSRKLTKTAPFFTCGPPKLSPFKVRTEPSVNHTQTWSVFWMIQCFSFSSILHALLLYSTPTPLALHHLLYKSCTGNWSISLFGDVNADLRDSWTTSERLSDAAGFFSCFCLICRIFVICLIWRVSQFMCFFDAWMDE